MSEIARSKIGVTTYLIPEGALNEPERIARLREAFDSCVEQREFQLVVDLSGVPLVNSDALELLLDAQNQLARVGGQIKLANLNAVIQDVFRLTGLADHIESIDDAGSDRTAEPEAGQGKGKRIGEILVARGAVKEERIQHALEIQRQTGERMAKVLVDKGWLAEKDLLQALSEQLSVPFIWLRSGVYDPDVTRLIELEVALRLKVMPLFRVEGTLYLATAEPQSVPSIDAVEDVTGLKVKPVLACTEEIQKTLAEANADGNDLSEFIADFQNDLEVVESRALDEHAAIDEMAGGSPVVNLMNGVIQRAVRDGASDIHIEASRTKCRIRLRVDGALYTVMTPPIDVHPALVSRLKVMAKLDIAERRLPQDGRIQVATQGRMIDLRFSSLPGIFGEKIVLRVLDKSQAILDIERLGLVDSNKDRFKSLLSRSNGLILVTGPTGTGKTTSLYAAINHLNSSEKNIVTIEDPVEYQIDGINQNQVKVVVGLGFAKILKHALRQDPDVIMVGEIRERETAEIAVQAALTGHLVLSTLHTNDSIGAITRMLDMGIQPFLLSSALAGVMAQRLLRMICPECKTSYVVPGSTLEKYGVEVSGQQRLARGRGCAACYDSGYKGRLAIHEILECDQDLQALIVSNPSRNELDAYIARHEIRTLLSDGLERAQRCETSLEEVLKAVNT